MHVLNGLVCALWNCHYPLRTLKITDITLPPYVPPCSGSAIIQDSLRRILGE